MLKTKHIKIMEEEGVCKIKHKDRDMHFEEDIEVKPVTQEQLRELEMLILEEEVKDGVNTTSRERL